jgi:hypothetical protein
MGRGSGGLAGDRLRADIDEGTWRETSYQVAAQQPHNNNWFAIADFIERLRVAGQLGEDAVADFATALESAGQMLTRVGAKGLSPPNCLMMQLQGGWTTQIPRGFDGLAVCSLSPLRRHVSHGKRPVTWLIRAEPTVRGTGWDPHGAERC